MLLLFLVYTTYRNNMEGGVDETDHVIILGKFENNKKYKEKTVKEIITAICAMLNTNGGKVGIHFETEPNILVGYSFVKMTIMIRIVEQSMISVIGLNQTVSKINFTEEEQSIIILVQKSESLITTNYNLYLPSESQVVKVYPWETQNTDTIIKRRIVEDPVQHGSHCKVFHKSENCGFHESKITQLKCIKAEQSKRTRLSDRMTGKGNKFNCYVSAFANYRGGHMYYGITDNGVVEGEEISNDNDISEITKKVEKAINKMIWPKEIDQPIQGEHWEIFLEPVLDKNSKPIPSTFVIVIYIAACLGGVFTEEPECYEMVKGKVQKMSLATWKKRMVACDGTGDEHSSPVEIVPHSVSRIQWTSDEIKQKCMHASDVLMDLINNGKWKELERKSKEIQQKYPEPEVALIVLSKKIIAYSRQGNFIKAEKALESFNDGVRNIIDNPFFTALASYLTIVLKRNKKDFKDIEKFLKDALMKAESIEAGYLTAAIHLLVVTVSAFSDEESGSLQNKLCATAIEHLQQSEEPNCSSRDIEQKAYITLAFFHLKCTLAKDLILQTTCTELDLNAAKSAMTAFYQSDSESPARRFRQIQTMLAKSVLYYRQAQKEQLTGARPFLENAINRAQDAMELAEKLKFSEMVMWSKKSISVCTEQLLRAQYIQQ